MAKIPAAGRLMVTLADEAATARLAQDVAAVLRAGDVVALSGGLGAGKTSFARALLRALAGDPALEVPSPTFPLRIDHALPRMKVVHADLYRLRDGSELEEIGLDEALVDSAVLVEWPERLPEGFAAERLDIAFEIEGRGRRAELTGRGSWPERLARTSQIRAFLDSSGWTDAGRTPIAGDASYRAYERIEGKEDGARHPSPLPDPPTPLRGPASPGSSGRGGRESAILMNAPARAEGPPNYGGRSYDAVAHRSRDVRAFVAIDMELRKASLHVPEILAHDIEAGLLLLDDLGSEGILDSAGAPIIERYEAAVDVLVFMHGREWPQQAPLPDAQTYLLPPYDREALLVEISLFPDWFGGHGGEPAFPPERREEFLFEWGRLVDRIDISQTTWVMRDFHSPNILWQRQACGLDRVGIIDFQDALIGHPAYDVASLAQDARIAMSEEHESRLKARYVAGRVAQNAAFDREAFDTAYAILGLQRATKVLGIFTRLALAEGKPGYRRHRAHLKALIHRSLRHPVLSPLRLWYEPYL